MNAQRDLPTAVLDDAGPSHIVGLSEAGRYVFDRLSLATVSASYQADETPIEALWANQTPLCRHVLLISQTPTQYVVRAVRVLAATGRVLPSVDQTVDAVWRFPKTRPVDITPPGAHSDFLWATISDWGRWAIDTTSRLYLYSAYSLVSDGYFYDWGDPPWAPTPSNYVDARAVVFITGGGSIGFPPPTTPYTQTCTTPGGACYHCGLKLLRWEPNPNYDPTRVTSPKWIVRSWIPTWLANPQIDPQCTDCCPPQIDPGNAHPDWPITAVLKEYGQQTAQSSQVVGTGQMSYLGFWWQPGQALKSLWRITVTVSISTLYRRDARMDITTLGGETQQDVPCYFYLTEDVDFTLQGLAEYRDETEVWCECSAAVSRVPTDDAWWQSGPFVADPLLISNVRYAANDVESSYIGGVHYGSNWVAAVLEEPNLRDPSYTWSANYLLRSPSGVRALLLNEQEIDFSRIDFSRSSSRLLCLLRD